MTNEHSFLTVNSVAHGQNFERSKHSGVARFIVHVVK